MEECKNKYEWILPFVMFLVIVFQGLNKGLTDCLLQSAEGIINAVSH